MPIQYLSHECLARTAQFTLKLGEESDRDYVGDMLEHWGFYDAVIEDVPGDLSLLVKVSVPDVDPSEADYIVELMDGCDEFSVNPPDPPRPNAH